FVEAATRYASTTGSGSACTVISTPCTLTVALGQLVVSDTLYLRAGTYTTYLNGDTFNWPSGSSGAPTTIAGYPGETVTIRPASESIINMSSSTFGAKTYIKFQNLILDGGVMDSGTQVVGSNGAQTHIEFDHITIQNNPDNNGFSVCAACTDWWIHHTTITNLRGGYGIYNTTTGTLFEYNTISGGDAYAIHSYNQGHNDVSNNIYRYNTITDNGHSVQFSAGAILASGSNNAFYGNLVYGNLRTGVIIDDCTDCLVYNNTIYGNGATNGGFGLQIGNSGTAVRPIIQNNIVAANAGANFNNTSSSAPTHDHNLCEVAGLWCDNTQAVVSIFTNAGSNDFTLKTGSLAIDTGTNLATVFTTDLNGTTRPSGSAFDLGALESGS
ncbi:MAG: right-handed parallel beta-helix repeat-containing protein, partial [Pseudomonadota bacterium]